MPSDPQTCTDEGCECRAAGWDLIHGDVGRAVPSREKAAQIVHDALHAFGSPNWAPCRNGGKPSEFCGVGQMTWAAVDALAAAGLLHLDGNDG